MTRIAVVLALVWIGGPAGCSGDDSDAPSDGGASGLPDHAHDPPDGADDLDGGAPETCDVMAPTACPDPPPRYADVQPIFQERCIGCHSGMPDGPWPLTSYAHVASWFGEIRGVMLTCAMPPADAGISMPTEEREEILTWIRCGFPQ